MTPPVASSVAVKFVVAPSPTFFNGKLIVIVSFGSGALFAGLTLSAVTVGVPPACTSGVPVTPQQA